MIAELIVEMIGLLLISFVLSVIITLPFGWFVGPWRNSKWIDERKEKLRKMNEEKNLEKLLKEMEEKEEDDEKE